MLDGLLEVIGVVASLIGIWEFLSRRAFARNLRVRISQAFKKTFARHRKQVDPCVVNRITAFGPDPNPIPPANMNRYVFPGSYWMKTQVRSGSHDIDVVASWR